MEVYNSEQAQIEAIKAWWDKHGKLVIVGIIALLVGVFGWRNWQDRQLSMADTASLAYFQMVEMAERDPQGAMTIGRHIVGEYSSTAYAPMASMMLARLAVEQGDYDSAEAHLHTVAQQRRHPELRVLAGLRLAQLLLSQQRYEQALAQLPTEAGAFQAASDELRGDILAAQGQAEQAIAAYRRALTGLAAQPERSALVNIKLADLGGSVEE